MLLLLNISHLIFFRITPVPVLYLIYINKVIKYFRHYLEVQSIFLPWNIFKRAHVSPRRFGCPGGLPPDQVWQEFDRSRSSSLLPLLLAPPWRWEWIRLDPVILLHYGTNNVRQPVFSEKIYIIFTYCLLKIAQKC